VSAALAAIVPGARATQRVISLDIARDLLELGFFIATVVYEDSAAIERQESAPEVHRTVAMFSGALAAPRDRKILCGRRGCRGSAQEVAPRTRWPPRGATLRRKCRADDDR
jgi:quinol monooxygenase YgiN